MFSLPLSYLNGFHSNSFMPQTNYKSNISVEVAIPNYTLQMDEGPFEVIPYASTFVQNSSDTPYNGTMSVLITFSLSNQSRLNLLLNNLSNSQSPQHDKFLNREEFDKNFSIPSYIYQYAIDYLSQYKNINIKTFQDRISIQVSGNAKYIDKIFRTSIYVNRNGQYFPKSAPEFPALISNYVSFVTGLTNSKIHFNYNMGFQKLLTCRIYENKILGGYPSPFNDSGTQLIYGSDLQVAYDEQSLLNITYPTNEVIATILWAGNNSSGAHVAPFDPSCIYSYYNKTLPSYEPHSKVYGVPLNGAVPPGQSASYDVTGAFEENTLDLEMIGSTAPGSTIYNVYGPSPTMENIDSSFAFILNPNSSYSMLNNVSVISNSWGESDCNNTAWFEYLEESQARGISVLASSGDSGDNSTSSKYTGSTVEFPSSMAYNDFGITAVGGDTLKLSPNLQIENETAWFISPSDKADGGPAGSTGGISTVFKEPIWQTDTEANDVIKGKGRGVPDISAIANNTLVYLNVNGTKNFYAFWGTSISSPVEAGIVAEINAVLKHYNNSNLGYLNPLFYNLANDQVKKLNQTSTVGYLLSGSYNSTLPALPFYNVKYGHNTLYNSSFGYSLVTGWGSIDAYNLSLYVLSINRTTSRVGLRGVEDILNLSGLNVTSYFYNNVTNSFSTVNDFFNASVQQNMFIADQYGAPLYWIQNVIYINGSQEKGWMVNYTGWVIYPFFGQYPCQSIYEYNYPAGKIINMPHNFIVETWLSNISKTMDERINFKVNNQLLSLPVPGAAYIINSKGNYSYCWKGHRYYNGPYPDNKYDLGLNPEFGLVGGPSGGLGKFKNPTSGIIKAYSEPLNSNTYFPSSTEAFNCTIDQTGEASAYLNYIQMSPNSWEISVSNNSNIQGIVDLQGQFYNLTARESGLPEGTSWGISLNGTVYRSAKNYISIFLSNGTYNIGFLPPSGYSSTITNFIFKIEGNGLSIPSIFFSSSNKTYINPIGILYPKDHLKFEGNTILSNFSSQSLGIAYDPLLNLIFIPDFDPFNPSNEIQNIISIYNLSTGKYLNATLKGYYEALYDPITNFLYAISYSGVLSEINPKTLSIVQNMTVYGAKDAETFLKDYKSEIISINQRGFSIIDLFSFTSIYNESSLSLSNVSYLFSFFSGNIAFINLLSNELEIFNLTNYGIEMISIPGDYKADGVLNFGKNELLISSESGTNLTYNFTNGKFSNIQTIKYFAITSICDPLSNKDFIFSTLVFNSSLNFVTEVNPANGKIIAEIPSEFSVLGGLFYKKTQTILANNFLLGTVSLYSIQHEYSVTFRESGLSSGTSWYVNISKGVNSGNITGSSYTVWLTNGTYSFSIRNISNYYITFQNSFKVSGNSTIILIDYIEYAHLLIKIYPDNSTVEINGKNTSLINSSFSTYLMSGTYTITVEKNGYQTYTYNFTVTAGSNETIIIKLTKINQNKMSSVLSNFDNYIIIALTGIVIILAGILIYKRNK